MTGRFGFKAFAIGAALVAIGAVAAPAQAKGEQWPTAEEAIQAFKTICVDHAGDRAAQQAAATSAPYNLEPSPGATEKRTAFFKFPWQAALRRENGYDMCVVTVGQPESRGDSDVIKAAGTVLGTPPGDIDASEDGLAWEIVVAGKTFVIVYQHQTFDDRGKRVTVASYGIADAQ